jgi:hypothetical protein
MSDEELDRAAACGYLAAYFDLWGRVNIREYAERDGRWYLDVTIAEPYPNRLPFKFIRREFGGRVITLTERDLYKDYGAEGTRLPVQEGDVMAWRAVGPRAYDVLECIRPCVDGPLGTIDFALDTYQFEEEEDGS